MQSYDEGSKDCAIEYERMVGSMQGILDRSLGCKFVCWGFSCHILLLKHGMCNSKKFVPR